MSAEVQLERSGCLMPKQNTTTKQSSGGGFQFENEVVAYALAHILARSSPFDPPGGVVERVDVQRPATEWHLDDLLVTVRAHGSRHRLAFSIKSNAQVSENGFPLDFVRDAWEQLLNTSSPAFEESRDYLGLITVPVDPRLKKAVFELLGLARQQDPISLAAQVDLPDRTNDNIRKLFRSAECPRDLAPKNDLETVGAGRLLRCVICLPLATRHHLAPILLRPKILDLLATRATPSDDLGTLGESDLARWFWDREVVYGPHAALRAEAARKLAQHLADKLVADVSLSALGTAVGMTGLSGIDELAEDRVLRRAEGRVAFDHDLYADWVRARQLADVTEVGQLTDFLAPRLSSPVWHRALRLYGLQLLEQTDDLAQWSSTFKTAGSISAPVGTLAQDILLESTAFASASGASLFRNDLWPLLIKHDGRLLDEVAPLEPRSRQGSHRRRASGRLIEELLLVAAYRGVPNPGDDKNLWFPVWERVVLDILEPLALADSELTEDVDDLLGSWGDYFMERVAGVVATIENPLAARRLWQPIIGLGVAASKWASRFARHWLAYALYRNAQGPVVDSWIAMIDTAQANPHWNAGEGYTINSHRSGELWRALLGFGDFGADVWTDELRPRVHLLRLRLATWAESHLANSDNVRAFAHFLTFPAASELVLEGLGWLDRESRSSGDRFWSRSNPPDEALFSLLAHVWSMAREALRRNETAFSAFRNLLQTLVSRQHSPALELAERVGSSSASLW